MAKDQALYEFGKAAKEIANLLESGSYIDQREQVLLENHLYLLGMAYAVRNRALSDLSRGRRSR